MLVSSIKRLILTVLSKGKCLTFIMMCTICAGCLPVYQPTTDISFYRKERVSFNPDYFYSTNHCVDSGRIDKIVKTSKLAMLVSDRLIRSQTHQLGLFSRETYRSFCVEEYR